jgi:uridine kinase
MAQWAPQRTDTMAALAAEILHNYGRGRVVVAVDGVDDAGLASFADRLSEAVTASGHSSACVSRGSGADSIAALTDAVAAFRAGTEDAGAGDAGDSVDAILVVDGPRINEPALAGLWNFSVWLDGGSSAAAAETEQERYIREVSPRRIATAIVDNSDEDHPRRRFADSC